MRIIFISDTHNKHRQMVFNPENFIDVNQENILIHSGDCTSMGKKHEVKEFISWLCELKGFSKKIFIAGNHDFAFEEHKYPHHKGDYEWLYEIIDEEYLSLCDVVYLEDSEYTLFSNELDKTFKFYGTPWQPEFFNWAFNLPRKGVKLKQMWDQIPNDTDILISHGPPYGIRDVIDGKNVGCELLTERVKEITPLIHTFGHIHDAYGGLYKDDTFYINSSTCNEAYYPVNPPHVIDIKKQNGKIELEYIKKQYDVK